MSSPITLFYKDKNILLTGGTGYLGKMIIEKLLRSTEIGNLYVLVRSSKNTDFKSRILSLCDEKVFSRISKEQFVSKVHAVQGDLTKKRLGMSDNDIMFLKKNVHIVFHCGASLNMDLNIRDAIMTNVNGTREILQLMKGSSIIEAFIHVSTAYSHCLHKEIEEKFYDSPIDPELLLEIAQQMDGNLLNSISEQLIGRWPNTYCFSKAVSENLLVTKELKLPVALFRPSIVTSTVSEPVPGWTDNLYGPLGILLSSNCGVMRVVNGDPNVRADTIPGDFVINGLLCYAWEVSSQWHKNKENFMPPVMNFCGNGSPLYLSIKEYTTLATESRFVPFNRTMWKPMILIIENRRRFNIVRLLLHKMPAHLFDFLLVVFGKKPYLRSIYNKLDKLMDVLCYFLKKEWFIRRDNMERLWDKMSSSDQMLYNFDINSLKPESYLRNLMTGLKMYTLKENMLDSDLHQARFEKKPRYRTVLFPKRIKKKWSILKYTIATRKRQNYMNKKLILI